MTPQRPKDRAPIALQQGGNGRGAGEFILGPAEVAQILKRSPQFVRGLAREGKLRAKRMGTRWRFRRDDVQDYLDRSSQIDKPI